MSETNNNTLPANANEQSTAKAQDTNAPATSGNKSPAWNAADPTDGRTYYDYGSKYPPCTRVQIFLEATYLALILVAGFYFLVWIFAEDIALYHTELKFQDLNIKLQQMAAFSTSGLIGGAMFGLKYLYHVTARGLWHEDRRVWRIFSPLLAAALSTMIGILIDGGIVHIADSATSEKQNLSTSFVSIGFITGYFADTALAKLQEIATVLFGSNLKAPPTQQK